MIACKNFCDICNISGTLIENGQDVSIHSPGFAYWFRGCGADFDAGSGQERNTEECGVARRPYCTVAANSSERDKTLADFVCAGSNDGQACCAIGVPVYDGVKASKRLWGRSAGADLFLTPVKR